MCGTCGTTKNNIKLNDLFPSYYRLQTKFAKAMFSQVSVCSQEWGCLYPGGSPSRWDLCPGEGSVGETPIQLCAGSTHPTGMHSFFFSVSLSFFLLKVPKWLLYC